MRFTSQLDYNTILLMNKELINTIIDTPVLLYKLNVQETSTNIYGEAIKKEWYTAVQIPCIIDRPDAYATADVGIVNTEQPVVFAFLRTELNKRNIYPEVSDIIEFHASYYEIHNTNEVQLYAGQVVYNHQILCSSHLTNKRPTQLEKPAI